MPKPLEGITVLDLTRVLAGPFCTMILADLGADVVKVERPGTGDDSRQFGPFQQARSLYFLSLNRGKKSIALNLKTDEGKRILKALIPHVDVMVENFRPGTMDKLGLGYETLRALHPGLIYAASSGFGHTGPDSRRPAYDMLVQAMGGIMSITGWPGMPPTRVGASVGDITAALFTAIGILSALYQRALTGEGQMVDVAMLDSQVAILENALVRFQVDGRSPQPLGNRHPTISPFQAFQTSDGYLALAIGNDKLWTTFCEAVERPDLRDDQRFFSNGSRTAHIEALAPILEALFRAKTCAEWSALFERAGIPYSPINSIEAVMQHPQVAARNMLVTVDDPQAGAVKIAGNPIKMTSLPETPDRQPPPEIGEHTADILTRWLGYSGDDIQRLRGEGVIECAMPDA